MRSVGRVVDAFRSFRSVRRKVVAKSACLCNDKSCNGSSGSYRLVLVVDLALGSVAKMDVFGVEPMNQHVKDRSVKASLALRDAQ
jgi:hypothetical protein